MLLLCSCGSSVSGKRGADSVTQVPDSAAEIAAIIEKFENNGANNFPAALYEEDQNRAESVRVRHKDSLLIAAKAILERYPELEDYRPFDKYYDSYSEYEGYLSEGFGNFIFTGNFYGERSDDVVLLLENRSTERVSICIVNKGSFGVKFVSLGSEQDEGYDPSDNDFYWAGQFAKVNAGEILYSNYEDDFRSLDEVPLDERVILEYDAIYAHVAEACGGGFIFWKDGKFNWLQQE